MKKNKNMQDKILVDEIIKHYSFDELLRKISFYNRVKFGKHGVSKARLNLESCKSIASSNGFAKDEIEKRRLLNKMFGKQCTDKLNKTGVNVLYSSIVGSAAAYLVESYKQKENKNKKRKAFK